MEEVWKDIKGYEGLYQVSSLGRVRSVDRWVAFMTKSKKFVKGKTLKSHESGKGYVKGEGYTEKQGYLTLSLYKDKKRHARKVHRLVAEAFIPNPNNYNEVNHKDENKHNNCVDNLEWCDRKYNCNYGTTKERMIEGQHSKPVNQYTMDGVLIKTWQSAREAGRNGFSPSYIAACCKQKYGHKSHKGYTWKYAS